MVLCVANEASHRRQHLSCRPITGRLARLLCPSFSLSEDALVLIHTKWKPHNATSQNVHCCPRTCHAELTEVPVNTVPLGPSILYGYGGTLGPSIQYRYGGTLGPSIQYGYGGTLGPSILYRYGGTLGPSIQYGYGGTLGPSIQYGYGTVHIPRV